MRNCLSIEEERNLTFALSRRIGSETQVEVIGGADKYIAVCRSCYNLPTVTFKDNDEQIFGQQS